MFEQAASIIKDARYSNDLISIDAISLFIERYFDDLKDEINNDPEDFFKDNYRFWKQLDEAALKAEEESQQVA